MSIRTQHEFLFIGRDEGSFVENYAYDLGESGDRSGKIFINLEIQNNPAESEMLGEVIFDTVRKAFFADLEKDPYARFENALKEVNSALHTLREEKVSKYLGNLHVLIVAVVDHNLFLTQCGDAEAYLIRRRFCSVVSEGLADPQSGDFFTNIASGLLEPGDFVLLSSTRLLRYIAKTDLGKIASTHNLVSILAELKDFLSTEVLGRIGCIGIAAIGQKDATAPQESGKILGHFQKDEEYENDGIQERKTTTITVTDIGKKVSDLFSSARHRIQSYQRQSSAKIPAFSDGGSRNNFDSNDWSKEKILMAFIVIVFVLGGGIWLLRSRSADQEKINQYTTILNRVQEQINIAETTSTYNPSKAAEILNSAEEDAKDVYNDRFDRNRASTLLASIQNMRDKIDGVVHVQPTVFVDLSKKRADVNTLGLLALKNTLYPFEYNALYPILLDKIQDPVPITIDDNATVIMGTSLEDTSALLFYTKDGKVLEYKDNRTHLIPATEGTYHKGVAVAAYGSRFYILDAEGNQIWRYTRRRDTFDTADKYNVEGDLTKAVSFAIDGRIYVLNSDGTLLKFLSGKKEDISIKKSPVKPLSSPNKIFTTVDMTRLYILESVQSRVLVYDKDEAGNLTYRSQFAFDGLKNVRDFSVSKDGKNMYLVDQSKVYTFPL